MRDSDTLNYASNPPFRTIEYTEKKETAEYLKYYYFEFLTQQNGIK